MALIKSCLSPNQSLLLEDIMYEFIFVVVHKYLLVRIAFVLYAYLLQAIIE